MGDSKTKSARLAAINAILARNQVGSQEELMVLLRREGYELTQATLSRDMKALHIVKVPTAKGYRYQVHGHPVSNDRSTGSVINVTTSGNLMVMKTGPGFAGAIASTIDNNIFDECIMGTIAGDDTVLVILRSADSLDRALEMLSAYIPGIREKLVQ